MDKKMVYFKYMRNDSDYYVENRSYNAVTPFQLNDIPADCEVKIEENSPWKYYTFISKEINDQGWKIHVSATLDNAQDILEATSKILFDRKIAFKHLKDMESLFQMNSKNGDRVSTGKFITIYPSTDDEFYELLNVLYEKLKSFENGPYILSDKCWKDSNIYYRYGAFKNIYNEKGELCIRDPNGNLIPDNRKPFYQVPEFVKEFDEFLDSKNVMSGNEEKKGKFYDYEFQGVLRYNNGGGIYVGIRKADQKKVVIKEGRPKAGLDSEYRDAIDRLNVEYEALTKLAGVKGVVNVLDYFKKWKHVFLVEEYVDGYDLQTWCALNYPFHTGNDQKAYIKKVKKIINDLIETVQEMHRLGVGMGDLQPANILITPDLNVKLIDFESASSIDAEEKATLQTIGFSNNKNKTHKERDWYAVKKILRFCILPVGPVADLKKNVKYQHDLWIQREFGPDVYQYVKEIEDYCDQYLTETKEKDYEHSLKPVKRKNEITNLIKGLRNAIEDNLIPDYSLVHGDVRQFVMSGGKLNVLTGGCGAALALFRSGGINKKVTDWIENILIKQLSSLDVSGLLTGKAGIAAVLYELGYKEKAFQLFNEISFVDLKDITLRSGLAGIGLALISLYLEEENKNYLYYSEKIAKKIEHIINENAKLSVSDWAALPMGLIDGWSGISLFYIALYSVTKHEKYFLMSKQLIERDLKNCKKDEVTKTLQTFDDSERLLPYLSGGSIGIGVAIWYLNYVSGRNLFQEELDLIIHLNHFKCAFNGGLFDGSGSFLLIPAIIKNDEKVAEHIQLSVKKLDPFLIYEDNKILFPGNFCYRLSDDYYSGSAGIILALRSIQSRNPLYWLPIVNPDHFLTKTKMIQEEIHIN